MQPLPQIGLPDLKPLRQGIILGGPTDTSVTAHIIADEDMDCFLEYGKGVNTFAYKIDLGDTFMSDKVRPKPYEAIEQRQSHDEQQQRLRW